jgi:hypothetical protein
MYLMESHFFTLYMTTIAIKLRWFVILDFSLDVIDLYMKW